MSRDQLGAAWGKGGGVPASQASRAECAGNTFSAVLPGCNSMSRGHSATPVPPRANSTLSAVTALASFRSEFEHLIEDTAAQAQSIVARAFLHLQRSIIVDQDQHSRWRTAFEREGEVGCERLGAVHLLLHGIWAVKTSAEGGRTDLVLGTPFVPTSDVESATTAMVLTEWKIIKDQSDLRSKSTSALHQAQRYSADILAGFELSSRRYLVLVSMKKHTMPPNVETGGVTYEYVNIPIEPDVPSREK